MNAALSEFDLIARYFKRAVPGGMVGGGDDCALFTVAPGMQVATSTDLLLEGRHFFSDVDPFTLGHKTLAVNLSDLAAMGATPVGCLLGLGLPTIDESWVARFAEGFYTQAEAFNCPLLGGDTTRSLHGITLSVTVFGTVNSSLTMRRNAAQAGDEIWVSGELGAADIACRMIAGQAPMDAALLKATRAALETPTPRIALGQALAAHAHAAIDISDGLLQDLSHVLHASGCGATLDEAAIPVHPALQPLLTAPGAQARLRQAILAGGDLYELCFTAPVTAHAAIRVLGAQLNIPVTPIGMVTQAPGLVVYDRSGHAIADLPAGFDHFRTK